MTKAAPKLEEIIQGLSPQLKTEVEIFVQSLLNQSQQPKQTKLRQDWAGMLKAENYTSVELQHLANEWRNS
jgi:hypothetical protein